MAATYKSKARRLIYRATLERARIESEKAQAALASATTTDAALKAELKLIQAQKTIALMRRKLKKRKPAKKTALSAPVIAFRSFSR